MTSAVKSIAFPAQEQELVVRLDISLKNSGLNIGKSCTGFSPPAAPAVLGRNPHALTLGTSMYKLAAESGVHGAAADGRSESPSDGFASGSTSLATTSTVKTPIGLVIRERNHDDLDQKKRMSLLKDAVNFVNYLQKKYNIIPESGPKKQSSEVSVESLEDMKVVPHAQLSGWSAISPTNAVKAYRMDDVVPFTASTSSASTRLPGVAPAASESTPKITIPPPSQCSGSSSPRSTTIPSCSSFVYEPQRTRSLLNSGLSTPLDSLASSMSSSSSPVSVMTLETAMKQAGRAQESTSGTSGSTDMSSSSTGQMFGNSSGGSSNSEASTSLSGITFPSLSSPMSEKMVSIRVGRAPSPSSRLVRSSLASDCESRSNSWRQDSKPTAPPRKDSCCSTTSSTVYPTMVYQYNSGQAYSSDFTKTSCELDLSEARRAYHLIPMNRNRVSARPKDSARTPNVSRELTQTTQSDSQSSTFPMGELYSPASYQMLRSSGSSTSMSDSKSMEFKPYMPIPLSGSSSASSLLSTASSTTVFPRAQVVMPEGSSPLTPSVTESITKAPSVLPTESDHSMSVVTDKTQSVTMSQASGAEPPKVDTATNSKPATTQPNVDSESKKPLDTITGEVKTAAAATSPSTASFTESISKAPSLNPTVSDHSSEAKTSSTQSGESNSK